MRVMVQRKPSSSVFVISAVFLETERAIVAHEEFDTAVPRVIFERFYNPDGHGHAGVEGRGLSRSVLESLGGWRSGRVPYRNADRWPIKALPVNLGARAKESMRNRPLCRNIRLRFGVQTHP